jgi:tetratricopeptide (TPR) repeat protein
MKPLAVLAGFLALTAVAAAKQSVDPPAANPAPPAALVPARPPVDPALPPPAQEPAPPPGVPAPDVPQTASGEAVLNEPAAPEAPPPGPAGTAAEDPDGAISAAPLQEVPEPFLPQRSPFEHQLAAYQAAARGLYDSALDHYEAALAGEPDNLRWGAEYRQVLIAAGKYDRGLKFFAQLAKANPDAANLHLNYGYAFVDKVPAEGMFGQMALAGNALREFGRSLEIEESWLGYFSRGSLYVYWPPAFGRASLGVADLERAIELAAGEPRRAYHARAYAALGDGFWRLGRRDAMRDAWRRGLELFPASPELADRLAKGDGELDDYLLGTYALGRRLDTRLEEIWQALRDEAP